MKSRLIGLMFILSLGWPLSAQVLTGTVCDQDRGLLAFVSVTANPVGSNAIEAFTQTDKQGRYQLKLKKNGHWQLAFSSISYDKTTIEVNVDRDTISVADVILYSTPIALQEIEIRPNVPIIFKKDTVIFNVSAFLRGNERVVEDVLKNLPGIEVDNQGTIRANGQEVEKVLLENDDLLNKGYALLTRGLTAKAITQVELIQGYTENRLAKGLVKSNKVALNLKLDNKLKHQWMGSLRADYGVKDVYAGQASLLGVNKKNKHYMFANINNNGYAAITDITKIMDLSDMDLLASTYVNIGLTLPNMDLKRCNFNQEKMISDNSILRLGKKWKVQWSVAANADKCRSYFQMLREYNIESTSFNHVIQNRAEEPPRNYIGKISTVGDLSDNSTLESTTQYRHSNSNINSLTRFNDLPFNENLRTKDDFFAQKLSYTNRLSEDKLLKINAHYAYNRIPQHYVIDSLGELQPRQFRQHSTNKRQQYGLAMSYLHSLNKRHKLDVRAGMRADVDADSHSDMQIKAWNYYAGLWYRYSHQGVSFVGGNTVSVFRISHEGKRTAPRLEPFLMWEWKPNKIHTLNLTWIYKHSYPPLADVSPYLLRNSLNASSSGAGVMKLLSNWMLTANYQYGNWTDIVLGNISFLYLKSRHYYASGFDITPEHLYVEKILLRNKEYASLSGDINYFVSSLTSNIKLSGGMEYMQYQYRINNIDGFQPFKSVSYTCGLSIKSAFIGMFNFDMGGYYTRKMQRDNNTYIAKSGLYTNLIFSGERWNIDINPEYFYWGATNSFSSDYCFIDAQASYTLVPNKWIVSIKGQNLLNVRTYMENSLSEISRNSYESRLLPRRVLASIEYKF